MRHKLNFIFNGIGDQVCTTSLPENYYNATGEKLVIDNPNIWAFKHNPYVEFLTERQTRTFIAINLMPDTRVKEQTQKYAQTYDNLSIASQAEWLCANVGIKYPKLRHPRLYIHENEKIIPNKIAVHTTGKVERKGEPEETWIRHGLGEDAPRAMTQNIIDQIAENYEGWDVYQVGGKDDISMTGKFTDLRGLDLWETAKHISQASRFIGVNSGMMHIAHCYPRVEKRIVMNELSDDSIHRWRIGDLRNLSFAWYDAASTIFNKTDYDIAYTYSYKKI